MVSQDHHEVGVKENLKSLLTSGGDLRHMMALARISFSRVVRVPVPLGVAGGVLFSSLPAIVNALGEKEE